MKKLLLTLIVAAAAGVVIYKWTDPLAALMMVPIIAKEGVEALRGKTCCDGACS